MAGAIRFFLDEAQLSEQDVLPNGMPANIRPDVITLLPRVFEALRNIDTPTVWGREDLAGAASILQYPLLRFTGHLYTMLGTVQARGHSEDGHPEEDHSSSFDAATGPEYLRGRWVDAWDEA